MTFVFRFFLVVLLSGNASAERPVVGFPEIERSSAPIALHEVDAGASSLLEADVQRKRLAAHHRATPAPTLGMGQRTEEEAMLFHLGGFAYKDKKGKVIGVRAIDTEHSEAGLGFDGYLVVTKARVDQLHDVRSTELLQAGVKKFGWAKAARDDAPAGALLFMLSTEKIVAFPVHGDPVDEAASGQLTEAEDVEVKKLRSHLMAYDLGPLLQDTDLEKDARVKVSKWQAAAELNTQASGYLAIPETATHFAFVYPTSNGKDQDEDDGFVAGDLDAKEEKGDTEDKESSDDKEETKGEHDGKQRPKVQPMEAEEHPDGETLEHPPPGAQSDNSRLTVEGEVDVGAEAKPDEGEDIQFDETKPKKKKKKAQATKTARKKKDVNYLDDAEAATAIDESDEDGAKTALEDRDEGFSGDDVQAEFYETHRRDFDCSDAPAGWNKEKKDYCCKHEKIGCPKKPKVSRKKTLDGSWRSEIKDMEALEDIDDELQYKETMDLRDDVASSVEDLDSKLKQANHKASHARDRAKEYAKKLLTLTHTNKKAMDGELAKQAARAQQELFGDVQKVLEGSGSVGTAGLSKKISRSRPTNTEEIEDNGEADGEDNCKCIKVDPGGHKAEDGNVKVSVRDGGKDVNVEYPIGLVESAKCQAWDKGTYPKACDGDDKPEDWCLKKWCYVDPCACGVSRKISTYLGDDVKFNKNLLHFSYATCGEKEDTYSEQKDDQTCGLKTDAAACKENDGGESKCHWEIYDINPNGVCEEEEVNCAGASEATSTMPDKEKGGDYAKSDFGEDSQATSTTSDKEKGGDDDSDSAQDAGSKEAKPPAAKEKNEDQEAVGSENAEGDEDDKARQDEEASAQNDALEQDAKDLDQAPGSDKGVKPEVKPAITESATTKANGVKTAQTTSKTASEMDEEAPPKEGEAPDEDDDEGKNAPEDDEKDGKGEETPEAGEEDGNKEEEGADSVKPTIAESAKSSKTGAKTAKPTSEAASDMDDDEEVDNKEGKQEASKAAPKGDEEGNEKRGEDDGGEDPGGEEEDGGEEGQEEGAEKDAKSAVKPEAGAKTAATADEKRGEIDGHDDGGEEEGQEEGDEQGVKPEVAKASSAERGGSESEG